MAIMTTGSHPKELWPGVKAFFGLTYDEHTEEFSLIFDQDSSDKAYEERQLVTGLGLAPVKNQGAGVYYDAGTQGYTSRLTNITYGLGFVITREAIEDGQYESKAKQMARATAFSMRQTKENVGANVLNRGFNSNYTGGDAKELFSTAHPTRAGNQSNHIATAADLSEASLEDLLIQVMGATDDRGLKISLIGRSLHVPRQLSFEATRILKSVQQAGTANNDVNALREMGMLPDGVKVNHYFSDADAWFVKTNCPEGMIYQNRRAVEFTQDNDFDTENAKAKATERYAFGWTDWRAMYGSPGA